MAGRDADRPQNIKLGVSLIIATALTISLQDVVFKIFSSNLTLWQIFTLRGILAVPLLIMSTQVYGQQRGIIRLALTPWPLFRSLCITMTFIAFYAAVPFLSLATVGAANYIAPVFVVLLSAWVIKETVGPLGWLGVLLGFAGVLILVQPGTDAFSPWTLLPIVGAAFYAVANITMRTRCQQIPLAAIALSQNFIMLLAGLTISLVLVWLHPKSEIARAYPYVLGQWTAVQATDWMVLLLLAAFSIVIGMMLAGAYKAAPASVVSTFEYSYLVFVSIWDMIFFSTMPTAHSAVGTALIVFAGLAVLYRYRSR